MDSNDSMTENFIAIPEYGLRILFEKVTFINIYIYIFLKLGNLYIPDILSISVFNG